MEKLKIETITAFISVDEYGNEGVMAFKTSDYWLPMVCVDEERIKSFLPAAKQIAAFSGRPFKIV